MEQTLQKYGLGVFVRPPVSSEEMATTLSARAPEGIRVSRDNSSVTIDVSDGFTSDETILLSGYGRGRFVFNLGQGSDVCVDERFSGARDMRVEMRVAEGARADYRSIQEEGSGFVVREAEVARGASLRWQDIVLGGDFARSFTSTKLVGENAETETDVIFLGTRQQEFDLMHEAVHKAPRTRSELRTRGILDGKAKTVARGLVRVEGGAVGCAGRQRIDTLLLSDGVEIDAVPNLEIANDDVVCAHGATASRLDNAKLFYMMSRGMDRKAAERAYLEAFLGVEDEELLAKILKKAL